MTTATEKSHGKRCRVVLVEDQPMFRYALRHWFKRSTDFEVVGEAEDRYPALDLLRSAKADLVIVDLALKTSDGLDLIKDIRHRWPQLPVLVMSMYEDSEYAERALRAGAKGYIDKHADGAAVINAAKRVIVGESVLSEGVRTDLTMRALGNKAGVKQRPPTQNLSDRELAVFEMIGRGQSNRDIAKKLHLGKGTVATYRIRIRKKFGLKRASQLVMKAVQWMQARKRSSR